MRTSFWILIVGALAGTGLVSSPVVGTHEASPTPYVYGGSDAPTLEPKGRFYLTRIRGRDLLVSPTGRPFVALGINHIGSIRTADVVDWRDVLRRYRRWGCTAVGNGGAAPLTDEMPYIVAIPVVRTSKYYNPPGGRNPYAYPDVFDPAVQHRLREKIEGVCRQHRDDPLLIAYCWTDTPCWDLVRTRALRGTDWVSEVRNLPSDAPGKRRYVAFLRERYQNDAQRLGKAYGLSLPSFDELPASDFRGLDRSWGIVLEDDEQFLGIIARQFYETIGTAQRQFDPTHLVFGEKYLAGDHPDGVLKAAIPYIDVLSIQPGDGYIDVYPPSDVFRTAEFDRLHRLTGKPIFVCDHQISFPTPEYPRTTWTQRPNQADAAATTARFMRAAFSQPYTVGYMRCQYIDRWDGRCNALKQGLLREDGSPYEEALTAFRETNHEIMLNLHKFLLRK